MIVVDRTMTSRQFCYHAPEAAEALNHPSSGAFAMLLWTASGELSAQTRERMYRKCGYIPNCGYPLARSGKIESMSRDDVTRAWATNPILIELAKLD